MSYYLKKLIVKIVMKRIPEKLIIKKPNETIAIVPKGMHEITLNQRKLYNALLLFTQSQAFNGNDRFSAYLTDIESVAGLRGSNRNEIKELFQKIRDTSGWIRYEDPTTNTTKDSLIGLIDKPEILDGRGKLTIVSWEIDDRIRSRVLNPINFWTNIELSKSNLRSGSSQALYELGCQYISNIHRGGSVGSTGKKALTEWIPRMLGKQRKKEYIYSEFRRDILSPAIKEVNEKTDIFISFEAYKTGRKVTELEFFITKNPRLLTANAPPEYIELEVATLDKSSNDDALDSIKDDLKIKLINWGITKKVIESVLQKYQDPEYIKKHVNQMQFKESNGTVFSNKTGYFLKSLEQDFQDQAFIPILPKKNNKPPEHQIEKIDYDLLNNEYQLMNAEQKKIQEGLWFKSEMLSTFKSIYRATGLENKRVRNIFLHWWMQNK